MHSHYMKPLRTQPYRFGPTVREDDTGFRYLNPFVRFPPNVNVSWRYIAYGSGTKSRAGHVRRGRPYQSFLWVLLIILRFWKHGSFEYCIYFIREPSGTCGSTCTICQRTSHRDVTYK